MLYDNFCKSFKIKLSYKLKLQFFLKNIKLLIYNKTLMISIGTIK